MAFLRAEYKVLFFFVVAVAALLYWSGNNNPNSHGLVAVSFVVGAFCSGLAGYLGMKVANKSHTEKNDEA